MSTAKVIENNNSIKRMIIKVIVDDNIKIDFMLITLRTFIQTFNRTFCYC